MFLDPKKALATKVKLAKSMGEKITPSKHAYRFVRYFGLVVAVLGVLILFY